MKKGFSRLVLAILILVALYLIGVNLALNLPAKIGRASCRERV